MSQASAYNLLPRPRQVSARSGQTTGATVKEIIDPSAVPPQGYRLSITPTKIQLIAHDAAGAFYGHQTLRQIARQSPAALPCIEITDYPDFPVRGVMLDISRDKVPTMSTLFALVDMLAEWKINQLQLYMEHTFAYHDHQTVWANASPMTADQIRALDAHCRDRFIDLVPNQNSFGHMERWLRHPQYRHLAEVEINADGADTPWGYRWKGPFSICPTDPKCLDFLSSLYAELLPNFSSKLFNVGCDETFDIGQGRSRALAAEKGKTRVYIDFLSQVHSLVQKQNRTMMFWGDIILHEPTMIADLPRPLIALDWGYEADHPFGAQCSAFAQSNVPFYVCPGTSSWLSIAGRTDNMLANQKSAAENGAKHGAIGYLNTDWGDHGHLQYLPISYAGFAMGAAMSWCAQSNDNLNLAAALDLHAFEDAANVLGNLALNLGNVYQSVGKLMSNSSALFRILVPTSTHKDSMDGITMEGLLAAQAAIDDAMKPLANSKAPQLILDEFASAAAMLRRACRIGMKKLDRSRIIEDDLAPIITEHRRLWLARNRPGGLDDSAAKIS